MTKSYSRAYSVKGYSIILLSNGRYELNLFDKCGVEGHIKANYEFLEDATEAGVEYIEREAWEDITDYCALTTYQPTDFASPLILVTYKNSTIHPGSDKNFKLMDNRIYKRK